MDSRAILLTSVLLVGFGCGDDEADVEPAPIQVEVSPDLIVSWDNGGVGEINVVECPEAFDTCPGRGCSGIGKWLAFLPNPLSNSIESPQPYGAPVAMSPGASVDDLEAGRTYSLSVSRFGECDPPRDDCDGRITAFGCTVFVP